MAKCPCSRLMLTPPNRGATSSDACILAARFGGLWRREWVNVGSEKPIKLGHQKARHNASPSCMLVITQPFIAHNVYEISNIGPKAKLWCNADDGFIIAAYAGFSKPGYGAQGGDDSGGFMADGSQQGSQSGGKVRVKGNCLYHGNTVQHGDLGKQRSETVLTTQKSGIPGRIATTRHREANRRSRGGILWWRLQD